MLALLALVGGCGVPFCTGHLSTSRLRRRDWDEIGQRSDVRKPTASLSSLPVASRSPPEKVKVRLPRWPITCASYYKPRCIAAVSPLPSCAHSWLSPSCPTKTTTAAAVSSSTTLLKVLPLVKAVITPSSHSKHTANPPTANPNLTSPSLPRRPYMYNSKARVAAERKVAAPA